MNILRAFTLSSLRKNKKRTIVTIIAIILTAAMLTGVTTLATSFKDMFIRQAINSNGNYHIRYNYVPIESAKYLNSHTLVDKSFISNTLGYSELNINRTAEDFLKVVAYDDKGLELQPIKLIEGRLPQNSREIIIEQNLVDFLDIEIGQELSLKIGYKTFIEETEQTVISDIELQEYTFEVVGLTERNLYQVGYSLDFGAVTFFDEQLHLQDGHVEVSVLLNNPKNTIEKANKIASDVKLPTSQGFYGNYNYFLNRELLNWQGASVNQAFVYFTETAALIIMLLVVIGAVIVIYNSFAISISERKKQFGMLRSVGATAKQIKRTVYWEGFVLSLIGVPIGIISGIFGIFITLKVADSILQDIFTGAEHIYLVVSPFAVLAAIAFMVITIFLSTVIPARKAAKISPIDAIRLTTDITTSKKSRSNPIAKFLFGIEGDIALKNLKRNRKRYFATILSLFISIVLFI